LRWSATIPRRRHENGDNIIEATARGDSAVPVAPTTGMAPSITILGGSEPIRW
jgi:hypothetical protein